MKNKKNTLSKIFIDHPFSLFFAWLFYLSLPLISLIRFYLITNKVSVSEPLKSFLYYTFTYAKYIIIFYCLIVLFSWFRRHLHTKISVVRRRILKFVVASGAVFYGINTLLLYAESRSYANFLYSHYGITYEWLQFINQLTLLIIALILFLFYYGDRLFSKLLLTKYSVTRLPKQVPVFITQLTILAVILGFMVSTFQSLYPYTSFPSQLEVAGWSYEEKLGEEYVYIEALEQFVPPESTIIHPTQSQQWPLIGNQPMIRYFLFPRKLVSAYLLQNQSAVDQLGTAYFAEINPISRDNQWPQWDESQKEITFDQKHYLQYSKLEQETIYEGVRLYRIEFL